MLACASVFFSSVVIKLRTWTPFRTLVTLLIPDSQMRDIGYYSGVIHLQRKQIMFCVFFRKLGFVTRIKLFKAFFAQACMDVSCGRLMTVGLFLRCLADSFEACD